MHNDLHPNNIHAQRTCPSCGGRKFYDLGKIPGASKFAGMDLDEPLEGGSLLECRDCALNFKSEIREPAFYDALYSRASAKVWESKTIRLDHELVSRALQDHCKGGDVLDIGCGSGRLLDMLPTGYQRYGIEIGEEARQHAANKNIKLVGKSFDDLSYLDMRFDAVVASDLIEHCRDPLKFVINAISILKPNGLLILSTGNADAPLWRLSGGRFWYCQIAEHLAYISPRWAEINANGRYNIVEVKKFIYLNEGILYKSVHSAALLCFHLLPKTYSWLMAKRRNWQGVKPYRPPLPGLGLTKDHFILVLRRLEP
jgi:2-polyprenyl-3-methyl-5-hydroxy-6-metoxy-1,4-benzoquinol methylase